MKRKLSKITLILLIFTLALPLGACAAETEASTAEPEDIPQMEFEDVSPDDWFYRYVTNGLRFGLIEGVGDGRFEPNRNVTRAEFITMLGRLHEYGNETIGTPGDGPFYERYLDWAVEMGIIHGNQYGDLMPHTFITREQMAVIVNRYIRVFELHEYVNPRGMVLMMSFPDSDISYWARGPVEFLRVSQLVFGTSIWSFRPRDNATRAEVLAILVRICSAVYDLNHPM